MKIKGSWVVKAPREKIYKIMTDFENIPKYFPDIAKSVSILDKNNNNVKLILKNTIANKDIEVKRNIQLNPPEGYKAYDSSESSDSFTDFFMTETPQGTKIDITTDFEIDNIFYALIFRIFSIVFIPNFWLKSVIKKRLEQTIINKLKAILE